MKVLISTSTFGVLDRKALEILEKRGCEYILNPHKRKLTEDEVIELAKGCQGIIAGTEPLTQKVFDKLPELKAISRCGTGMDSVDIICAEKCGISVRNTPDVLTQAVAELVVGYTIDASRNITLMDREVRKGIWKKRMGQLVQGKTVGIIGLGRIGKRLVELLEPFGAGFKAYEPNPDKEWLEKHNVDNVSMEILLESCDIVTIHVPYKKELYHLLGREKIGLMKKGSILINASRGGLVDEDALYEALKSGCLGYAVLDTFEKEPYEGPLKEIENIILTPHIGSYAKEARINMEIESVENLLDALKVLP